MPTDNRKLNAIGCIILLVIVFLFFLGFLSPALGTFSIVPVLFVLIQILFFYGILRTIFKIIRQTKETKNLSDKQHKTSLPNVNEQNQQENHEIDSEQTNLEQSEPLSIDVQKAFLLLGLSPNVSYTKVSERYYELTKKINSKKMDEAQRQKRLEEINKAYEVLTDYYSKMS
ncbi:MAG: hypothetical protein N2Z58_04250 [Fervidobacterium sp.]|nr:hypothetical protein [Fervidobacterium sp.]